MMNDGTSIEEQKSTETPSSTMGDNTEVVIDQEDTDSSEDSSEESSEEYGPLLSEIEKFVPILQEMKEIDDAESANLSEDPIHPHSKKALFRSYLEREGIKITNLAAVEKARKNFEKTLQHGRLRAGRILWMYRELLKIADRSDIELDKTKQALEEAKKSFDAERAKLEAEIAKLKASRAPSESLLKLDAGDDASHQANKRVKDLEIYYEQKISDLNTRHEEAINALSEFFGFARSDALSLRAGGANIQQQPQQQSSETSKLQAEITRLRLENDNLRKTIGTSLKNPQVEQLQIKLEQVLAENTSVKSILTKTQAHLDRLNATPRIESQNQNSEATLRAKIEELEEKNGRLQSKLNDADQHIDRLNKEIAKIQNIHENTGGELRARIQELEETIRWLEEQLNNASASTLRSHSPSPSQVSEAPSFHSVAPTGHFSLYRNNDQAHSANSVPPTSSPSWRKRGP